MLKCEYKMLLFTLEVQQKSSCMMSDPFWNTRNRPSHSAQSWGRKARPFLNVAWPEGQRDSVLADLCSSKGDSPAWGRAEGRPASKPFSACGKAQSGAGRLPNPPHECSFCLACGQATEKKKNRLGVSNGLPWLLGFISRQREIWSAVQARLLSCGSVFQANLWS